MALALLELIDVDDAKATFRVDTGTNTQYQLRFGREVREDTGGDAVDDVYFTTPTQRNDAAGDAFASSFEVGVPLARLERRSSFAQLVTSKAGGKSQAASDVVPVPGAGARMDDVATGFSMNARHNRARSIPNRTTTFSRQASWGSLIGDLVKVAAPAVLKMISGPPGGSPAAGGAPADGAPLDIIAQVLKAVLGAIQPPGPPALPVSTPKSIRVPSADTNRFIGNGQARYAQPFIFGIDDALLASLAGPVIQALPQILNAANQKRIEMKKADNLLMGGIVSDISKRLMMEKVLEAQRAAKDQGPAAALDPEQLKAIADLLAQLPATSGAKSLVSGAMTASAEEAAPQASARAMLTFDFAPSLEWNGASKPVFDRTRSLRLRPRLVVAPPIPKAPLPKAILKVVLQDADNPDVRLEKSFRLRDVAAGAPLDCAFEPGELAHLRANARYDVIAELRWPSARTGQTRACGSAEIVLVDKHFVKSNGAQTSEERELTDMSRYRPFWNRIWEAPTLASKGNGAPKKFHWELDVNARYSVLLSASHDSNGLMETKLLQEADNAESLKQSVRGRMKAGIELSVAELNKLIPLWNGVPMVEAAKLEALGAKPFLESASREFKHRFQLKGRAGEGGMVWVIPVFRLHGIALSTVATSDDNGQVVSTSDEDIQFPLPVAARLIGLRAAA